MEPIRFAKLMQLADQIEHYRFQFNVDDPEFAWIDGQNIKDLAKLFVSAARTVRDKEFQEARGLIDPEALTYDLHTDLRCLVDRLREIAERPEGCEWTGSTDALVDQSVIDQLRQCPTKKFDLSKVVRFCEELNSSYSAGNYLASTLLIRALLNHVPPLFGHGNFQQVVAHSSRSVKEVLKPLEEGSRDVADLHSHSMIRHKENLPTKAQVEPFKVNLEVLLHEIVVKAQEPA